jgi:hypothetical protein
MLEVSPTFDHEPGVFIPIPIPPAAADSAFHSLAGLFTAHFHLQEGFAVTAKQFDSTIECVENGSKIAQIGLAPSGRIGPEGHS